MADDFGTIAAVVMGPTSDGLAARAAAAADAVAAQHARSAQAADDAAALRVDLAATRAELTAARAQIRNLEQALETNRAISMAIGIVMARRYVDADQAFDILRRVSQRQHRKLREVADDVVFTGELPAA